MKLAEALAERGDLVRRTEHLRGRIVANARYQEGEQPAEDAGALLAELGEVLDRAEMLIRRINRTNSTAATAGGTVTDALARRDALRIRHRVVTQAADAASGGGERSGYGRQLRSELVHVAALPVAELRRTADDIAREIRQIDLEIQRVNWEIDLVD
jgi:hypothetical protein